MEFDAVVNGVEKRLRITPHGIMAGDALVGEDAKIMHPQFHPTRGLHLSASEQTTRRRILPRMVSWLQTTTRRMIHR